MSLFYIYIIGICDTVKDFLFIGGISIGLLFPMILYAYYENLERDNVISEEECHQLFSKHVKEIVSACIIAVLLSCMIPSSGTMASMYLLPRLTDAEKMKNIDPKSLEVLQSLSEKWLEEIKDKR